MSTPVYLLLGLALGASHLGSLRWLSLRLTRAPAGHPAWPALVQLLRMAVLVGAFAAAARQGAPALAALAAGELLAHAGAIAALRYTGWKGRA